MLVIVHYGNIQFFFQSAFYFEAFRCLDIFQVDTSKSRGNSLYGLDEFLGLLFIYFDVEYINTCIDFEEQSFAFHYGFTAQGADVSQPEYGSTVRNNGYQISFGCVFVGILRIFLYFQTGFGYAG